MVNTKFVGEWKYLNKALFELSETRAEKACLELALFLRMIDDEERISEYHKTTGGVPNCGRLMMKDGEGQLLTFREVANKIIHASRLSWNFLEESRPLLICHSRDEEKWIRAEVQIVALASVCAQLMS